MKLQYANHHEDYFLSYYKKESNSPWSWPVVLVTKKDG